MHPHRVEVLDRADDNDVIAVITHQLEFVFLPSEDRLLEKYLGGRACLESCAGDASQVGLVVGNPRSGPTHRERGTHNDWIAEDLNAIEALVERVAHR